MTKQEKIIVSAYTGVLMCDFDDVHEYIQKKLSKPVFTHELADKDIQKEVEEKLKEEFLEICNREEPERKKGTWIKKEPTIKELHGYYYECSKCHKFSLPFQKLNFCPNCGSYNGG